MTGAERAAALAVALEAARAAGDLLLEHLGAVDPREIGRKSSARDLVTAADVASERLLVARLRDAFPDHAIESEEEVKDPADDRLRWFLDPLDGTVNFVHRLPCFAVSMGLWSSEGPEVAVVHLPYLRETFHATRGGGAFLNGRPIQVSNTTELSEGILATGFPYRRHELVPNNLENFNRFFLRAQGLRRMGSAAIDLAYVADGRLDGYWELYLSPHDVAAGGLLVREAGGLVTDVDGGEDWLRGAHIVAAPPGVHEAIRSQLEHGTELP
ncbi:MAG: inositol monophosphatase family protein [Planctomycetota bacterium]|nr:inositol monophosphatase family protein [Planctomycetota bacterium]